MSKKKKVIKKITKKAKPVKVKAAPAPKVKKHVSFVELVKKGKADIAKVDDFIDQWHEDPNTNLLLHEYLGLTWAEYKRFVTDITTLPEIVQKKKLKN